MSIRDKSAIALAFHDLGVIKFGEFQLKSGISSPVYVDLRILVSSPKLMEQISRALCGLLNQEPRQSEELICGVPYAALPIAACISVQENIPMIMCRKEAKSYGTKQMVEGSWKAGQSCIIIEDVITSGSSIASVAQLLRNEGLSVSRGFVIVDREQGGIKFLKQEHNIQITSLFTLRELVDILYNQRRLNDHQRKTIHDFLQKIQTSEKSETVPLALKFSPDHATRLNQLIATKSTRLCLALDTTDPDVLLKETDLMGPKICALKMHLDILRIDPNPERVIHGLKDLSVKHGFLLIEDRKLSDIGQTVYLQLLHGVYRVAEWCDLVTVHCIPGPGIFEAIRETNRKLANSGNSHQLSTLVVVNMSSKGSLTNDTYATNCCELIKAHSDVVTGLVSQERMPNLKNSEMEFSYWVPGLQLSPGGDHLGQSYQDIGSIYQRFPNDQTNVIVIVGRGITQATHPLEEAERYRLASLPNHLSHGK